MLLYRRVTAGKLQERGHNEIWPVAGLQQGSLCHSDWVDHIHGPFKTACHLSFSHSGDLMQHCSLGTKLIGFSSSLVKDSKFAWSRIPLGEYDPVLSLHSCTVCNPWWAKWIFWMVLYNLIQLSGRSSSLHILTSFIHCTGTNKERPNKKKK